MNRVVTAQPKKKRGCVFRMLGIWFGLLTLVLLAMVLINRKAGGNPELVQSELNEWFDMELPPSFYPYRKGVFMDLDVYAFWSERNPNEDGRSTAVISFSADRKWREKTLTEVEQDEVKSLEERLKRNEFETRAHDRHETLVDGETVVMYRFSGLQRMNKEIVEASACFRFITSANGIMMIQTLGIDATFPSDQQVRFLTNVKVREKEASTQSD